MKRRPRRKHAQAQSRPATPAPPRPPAARPAWFANPLIQALVLVGAIAACGLVIWLALRANPPAPAARAPAATNLGLATPLSLPAPDPAATNEPGAEPNPNDPNQVATYTNNGNSLLEQGKIDEAIALYQRALSLNPEDEDVHYNLGSVLARQAKSLEAIAHFAEAVRLLTNYFQARFNLGQALMVAGRHDEAISQFNEVLRLQPDFEPARQSLARAREKLAPADSNPP